MSNDKGRGGTHRANATQVSGSSSNGIRGDEHKMLSLNKEQG